MSKHKFLPLFATIALCLAALAGCDGSSSPARALEGKTLALFGGSYTEIPASAVAKDYWQDSLGVKVVNYGVGGAGFSNLTQGEGKHIQWQVDQACAPDAPVYDIYLLWASTNDFYWASDYCGTADDYTDYDGYDTTSLATQCGGINYAISKIREKAPGSQILFMTSTKSFRAVPKSSDPRYIVDKNGMNYFVEKQILCCQAAGVPYLDLFTIPPFNEDNASEYYEDDGIHLNENGYKAIRDLQVKFLTAGKTIRGTRIITPGHDGGDWSQYDWYAVDNANLKKRPKAVLYGDSITHNWPGFDPDFFTEHNFVGRGIGGQTSLRALTRFRKDVIELHPEYVAIMFGVNDIAENRSNIQLENVYGNLVSVVELARANGIKPLICSVTPADTICWRPLLGNPHRSIEALNGMLSRYANENGIPYVDYWSVLNNGKGGFIEGHSSDGLHPNLDGYRLMEPVLLQYIK
ncbi:MAG: SGNH/GDSL hydrolase family protein [Bacteroidales bacterium]|nr:SGNH/GDSL hydrolase family protein [Bacteroidales bacterium]